VACCIVLAACCEERINGGEASREPCSFVVEGERDTAFSAFVKDTIHIHVKKGILERWSMSEESDTLLVDSIAVTMLHADTGWALFDVVFEVAAAGSETLLFRRYSGVQPWEQDSGDLTKEFRIALSVNE
jgi:hypothetical protein